MLELLASWPEHGSNVNKLFVADATPVRSAQRPPAFSLPLTQACISTQQRMHAGHHNHLGGALGTVLATAVARNNDCSRRARVHLRT